MRNHVPTEAERICVGDNRTVSIFKILRSRGIEYPPNNKAGWLLRISRNAWVARQLTKNGQPFADQMFTVDINGKFSWKAADS